MDEELKQILREMLFEFENNRLEVILIPQDNPSNIGACLRSVINSNCEWYKNLCSDFPSYRKRPYKRFKTAVKRKSVRKILTDLINEKTVSSKYADWIIEYANNKLKNLNIEEVIPF